MSGIDSRKELESALVGMSRLHQMAFGAACCERLLPNYRRFSEEESWGDWGALRAALDAVWRVVLGGSISASEASRFAEALKEARPTPGSGFSSDHTSAALDASAAVSELVEMCVDGEARHAVEAGALGREGIFMYLDAKSSTTFSASDYEDHSKHPLMHREVERQQADLVTLKRQETPSGSIADTLRRRSNSGTLAG